MKRLSGKRLQKHDDTVKYLKQWARQTRHRVYLFTGKTWTCLAKDAQIACICHVSTHCSSALSIARGCYAKIHRTTIVAVRVCALQQVWIANIGSWLAELFTLNLWPGRPL